MSAKIGNVECMESGYGFILEDSEEVPAIAFVYPDEATARVGAKLIQAALERALVLPACGF